MLILCCDACARPLGNPKQAKTYGCPHVYHSYCVGDNETVCPVCAPALFEDLKKEYEALSVKMADLKKRLDEATARLS